MYLGSVRFFKHLVIFIIILLIVIPLSFAINFWRISCEQEARIEKLLADNNALLSFSAQYNLTTELSADDIYNILQEIGIKNADIVNKIYNMDKDAFKTIENSSGSPVETEPQYALVKDDEKETSPPLEELEPYMTMFPELYSDVVTEQEYQSDGNYIYLTFDDGPSENTPLILDYLKKHDVKATFFVIPKDTGKGAEYLNRILSEGHALAIHTFTHDYKTIYESVESFLTDFDNAYNLVYKQTGYKPFLFRFPGGSVNDYNDAVRDDIIMEMTRRGFVYYDWNVDSGDAMGADWTAMYYGVQEQVKNQNRSVILFHDGPGNLRTVYVIEDIISILKNDPRGYTFSSINANTRPMHF